MNSVYQGKIKRILMTADAVGGVWTYVNEMARELRKYNIEIVLAVMGPKMDSYQREMVDALDNVQLFESNYSLEWMDNPWKDIEDAGEWLLELEILTHPDIIHLNGYVHAALPWHAPVVIMAHSCVCSWFDQVERRELPDSFKIYKERVTEGLQCAECVIAPGRVMADSLLKNYGKHSPVIIIPNGNRGKIIQSNMKESFVLTAGRMWDKAKNIEVVAKIASNVSWPVYAAGEGNFGKKVYENFNILGKLSHDTLTNLMDKAPIFALPAKYEPFGYCALEAAKSGCALVLGDIPSLREIWDDAAVFVNPEEPEEIKDALSELIRYSKFRLEYMMKASERAKIFSANKMVKNYVTVYETLKNCKSKVAVKTA